MSKWIGILLIMLSSVPAGAKDDFCHTTNKCLQAGEKLRFVIYYNLSAIWVAAGEAAFTTSLTDLNGKKVFHIVGDGRTYDHYNWIFKVRDRYETFLDTSNLLPYKFIRDVNEDGYKIFNHVTFNRDYNKAYSNRKRFDVPVCVQDVLSAIYYARNIDYSKYKTGDKIPFSMFLDDEVYHLYIRYAGKARIKTKYGIFNAIKITPLLIEGTLFKGGEDMVVWVSDDRNHIPLRVESPILVGSVKVDLMSFSKLRHPLTSLIKKL